MKPLRIVPTIALVALATAGIAPATAAPSEDTLLTTFTLLVGRPDPATAGEARVEILPGTVLLPGEKTHRSPDRLLRKIEQLKQTFRLKDVKVVSATKVNLAVNRTETLALAPTTFSLEATAVSFDDEKAMLDLRLLEGTKVISAPRIMVLRGEGSSIGGGDGDAAPYFFLLIEPATKVAQESLARMTSPVLIHKVAPQYPEAARREHIQGMVILDCTIDAEGRVTDLRAVNPAPNELAEAAKAAVSQWRYKPLLNAKGNPETSTITLTINFLLDNDKTEKK